MVRFVEILVRYVEKNKFINVNFTFKDVGQVIVAMC